MPIPTKSVICPMLIGRTAHLQALAQLITTVRHGQGQLALLSGEAGLGKSRLVSHIASTLASEGWIILRGQSHAYEREFPYAALVDLLRSPMLGPLPAKPFADLLADLGPPAAVLASLLPERRLVAATALPDKPLLQAAWATCCRILTERSGVVGVLLILEDLHWSDAASLEWLLSMARSVAALPVLLIGTYRPDALSEELRHFLAQVERGRGAVQLHLPPLVKPEVDRMLRAIFEQPHPVRAEFLDAIMSLTEGNPFLIEEMIKAMLMAGEIYYADGRWDRKPLSEIHIPHTIDELLRRRSQELSPPARELLTIAAVVGRQFEFDLIQQLTEWPDPQLVDCLKELIAAQLVIEDRPDRFTFRHALMRYAIQAPLLSRERRLLHQRIGMVLMQRAVGHPDPPIADLAYHCYEGGLWEPARTYAIQAAERALALYTPSAALTYLDHAQQCERQLGHPADPALLLLLGRAHLLLSNFALAQQALEQILLLPTSSDRQIWQCHMQLGLLWATRDYHSAEPHYTQALAMARQLATPAYLAETLNQIGNWHMNQEQPHQALLLHHEALAIFTAQQDTNGIAQTLDLIGITANNCGDLLAGHVAFQQALAHWRALDDQQGLLHSLAGLALSIDYRLEVNPHSTSQARAWAEQSLAIAQAISWSPGVALAQICCGLVAIQAGQYAQALETLSAALHTAEAIEHLGWMTDSLQALGALYLDLGAYQQALGYLQRSYTLAQQLGSMIWRHHAGAALIQTYLGLAEFGHAEDLIRQLAIPPQGSYSLGQRRILAAQAEYALARADTAHALLLIDRLIGESRNPEQQVIPYLWYLRAFALHTTDPQQAYADLQAAVHAVQPQGRQSIEWRIWSALAHVAPMVGMPAEAAHARQQAHTLVSAMLQDLRQSQHPAAAALAEGFEQYALATLPAVPPAAAPRESAALALTPREYEVATLIAQGYSNRAIAAALVLSERTAERHVANIMAKLAVNSRAQIAAWVVAQRHA